MKKIIALISVLTLSICAVSTNVNAASLNRPRDPNGDGVIDLSDAVYILQFLKGRQYPEDLTPLDVDGNGIISKVDSEKLQQWIIRNDVNIPNAQTNDPIVSVDYPSVTYIRKDFDNSHAPSDYDEYTIDFNSMGRSIIGEDNGMYPDSTRQAVVRISDITNGGGGTGFIVGNHIIATAAHCVYNKNANNGSSGFKNLRIQIKSIDGTSTIATLKPRSCHFPKKYKTLNNYEHTYYDYALIYVEDDLSQYDRMDLGVALNSYLVYPDTTNAYFTSVSGFSSIIPDEYSNTSYTRYVAVGSLLNPNLVNSTSFPNFKDYRLLYTTDTAGGDSGGPVFFVENYTVDTVIGIHTNGTDFYSNGNSGIKIKPHMLKFYYNNIELVRP